MSQLEHHVSVVRSREGMSRALSALAWGAVGVASAATVAVLLEKFLLWRPDAPSYRWLAGRPLVALAIAGGVAATAAVAWGIRRRPSVRDAAISIDERLGTKEKFSTALYLQNDRGLVGDPFAQAMVRDALATADRVTLADRFPIRVPRQFGIALAIGVVAFGLTFVRQRDLFQREEKAQLAKVEAAKQAEAKKQMEQVLAQINVAPADVQANPEVTLAKQNLTDVMRAGNKDPGAAQRTAAKAQQALNDAQSAKERVKNAQQFAKAKQNQRLLASLAESKDDKTPVAEMARDIKAGEFDRAMERMAALAKGFDKMDAAEQQKATDQMNAMANQLQQALQQNTQLQQLAQQMQQNGVTQQQAQQMQQLMQQAAQGNPQAAQQAQQMAQQMMQQANATPQQQQAVQQLASQMQGIQNSQALMQQLQQAAAQMGGAMQQQQQQAGQAQQPGQQQGQQPGQQQGQQPGQQQGQQPGQQQGQQPGQQQGQQPGQQQGQQPGQQQGQQPGQQQGQQPGQQQGQQPGQQQGQQPGQQQGQQPGQQPGQQQGQQPGGQQPGGQQGQAGGQPQGGQGQQGGMDQGAQQMQDAIDAIKKDMQQMQAAQRQGQQQQGQQQGNQQGGGQQPNGGQQGGQQGNQQGGGQQGGQNGGRPQEGNWNPNPGQQQGDPNQARGGGGGGGAGRGNGGVAPMEQAPFDFKEELSKSHDDEKGQTLAQTFVKADAEVGEAKAELREVVRSNLQQSTDEVDSQRISRQAQKAVRDYFTTITGEAPATPAAPAEKK